MRASLFTSPKDSFAASLDARVKLSMCFGGSVASIILSSPLSLGLLALSSAALALNASRLATVLKVYLLASLMMLSALGCSALIGLAVPGLMRWDALSLCAPFLRMLISINLLLVLAMSTPVQALFKRLQAMRLPAWLRIPISVAIRFVPVFLEDCAQIRDAVRLRPGKGLRGLWRGFAVPLIFRVLYSADDLAVAAELKGMGQAERTREKLPGLSRRDFTTLALAACLLAAAIILQSQGPQFRPTSM
ncbi:MAG: energy-coupling factor transporter transmembrane protein EcfT [Deltaproteobacteria bacterium]|jgi:energy-coupling factor transport system permease protein|nr:energy-coupling factor transporter transmembrane protein EcfT [Deltaproteobacteria bacterium]